MKMTRGIIFFAVLFVIGFRVVAAETSPAPRDLFRFDDVVSITAPIAGDIYAFGRIVQVRGTVAGDVLVGGGDITIAGPVAGDVRIVADAVTITSVVSGNVSIVARSLRVAADASVGKNFTFVGQQLSVASAIAGDAFVVGASDAHFSGHAAVRGTLRAQTPVPPVIDDGVILAHPLVFSPLVAQSRNVSDFIFNRIIALFSLLLIGLVVVHLFLKSSLVIASFMSARGGKQFLVGLLFLLLPPIIVFLLLFTVIGLPLAVIAGIIWGIIVYSARIFAALTIGLHLFSHYDHKRRFHSIVLPLVVGVVCVTFLESLPRVGFFFTIFFTLWAVGGIGLFLRALFTTKEQPQSCA